MSSENDSVDVSIWVDDDTHISITISSKTLNHYEMLECVSAGDVKIIQFVKNLMDNKYKAKNYNSNASAVGYSSEDLVNPFQNEEA